MSTTELTCGDCGTAIKSKFAGCSVCRLSDDMYDFLMVFIKARGSIKEMEKELGISYPTVRSRIDDLQRAMGFQTREMAESSRDILDALEKGEISAEEAEARLKGP
jgi:hypothetical protein